MGEKSSPSIRAYVMNVICPYFNVPPDVVAKEGRWEACVPICSENVYRFARNVLYQRRKSMKSAVELVLSVKSHDDGKANEIKVLHEENEELRRQLTRKNEQISELKDQLDVASNSFTKELEDTRTKYEVESKRIEAAYTEFVQDLVKNHRREMDDMRRSMKTAQNIQKTFIDSYVEASLDCLQRSSCDSPPL
jgi:hypothetical protein